MQNEVPVCCKCKSKLTAPYYFRMIRQKKSYYCESCLSYKYSRRYKYMDSSSVKKLMQAYYTLVNG